MNTEILKIIFTDSFLAHFVFTLDSELAFTFARAYGLNSPEVYFSALLGSFLGIASNFIGFYVIAYVLKNFIETSYNYKPMKFYFNKFKILFLGVSAFSGASILGAFFAGLLRLQIFSFCIIVFCYRLAYVMYYYFRLDGF